MFNIFNFLDKLLEEPKSEPKPEPKSEPKPKLLVVCSKCQGTGFLPQYNYYCNGTCFRCDGKGYTSGSKKQLIEWKMAQNAKRAKERAESRKNYLKEREERLRNAVVEPKVTPVSNKVKYAEVDFSPKPSDWVDSQLSVLNPRHPRYEQAKKIREFGFKHCSQGFIKNSTKVQELRKRI